MVKVGRETGIFYDFQAAQRSTSGHPNSVWMGFSATQVQAGVHTDYLASPDFKQGTKIMKKRKRKQRGEDSCSDSGEEAPKVLEAAAGAEAVKQEPQPAERAKAKGELVLRDSPPARLQTGRHSTLALGGCQKKGCQPAFWARQVALGRLGQ